MRKPIRRAAVIGAGVMGSGIAAHFANAGLEVLLLDIVPPEPDRRREEAAARRATASPPAGSRRRSRRSPPRSSTRTARASCPIGNIEDDLEKLADVRPRHRGHRRAARAQAGALREAREGRARATASSRRTRRACASPT